jgi:hypothetical protein
MKRKSFMKKHLIDVTFGAEAVTGAGTDLTGAITKLSTGLHVLQDWERKRIQHLGTRNETFSMAAIEVARQHPQVIPAGIDMAALERDIAARQQILPLLVRSRQLVRMLEDTLMLLGSDIYNGARGIYKSLLIVGELYGMAEVVDELSQHFSKSASEPTAPAPAPSEPGTPA